tara:strand:- start:544 stop:1146 length:603 start_codon:yes stop_codon:yes gene_type:complete
MSMEVVLHRVNTIEALRATPTHFGAEIDIRTRGSDMILNHEPYEDGDRLEDFMENYAHGLLILNIKEDGLEDAALALVRSRGVERYFLLDVEFPYISRSTRKGEKAIAIRYSEDESIETVKPFAGKADWVWVDTITHLPLTENIVKDLAPFKTCLVCPERWGRPDDIPVFQEQMQGLGYCPDAVMTARQYAGQWTAFGTT